MSNLQFLTFFINTIAAVLEHEELLGAAIASASNDLRLGANEAPPAILSVFIGKQLTKVIEDLENVSKGKLSPEEKTDLKLNVIGKIPEILLDNTDRNRTSPFAFTGNKFEFRAVGSKANCAKPMTFLNAMVSEKLISFKEKVDSLVDEKDMKKDDAIFNILRDQIKEIKPILFEGDGYSNRWTKEAKKRKLSHNKSTPEAMSSYLFKKSIKLFSSLKILSQREIEARYIVDLEEYTMRIQIEARTLGDISRNHIIPTAINYQNTLLENVKGLKEIYGNEFKNYAKEQMSIIERISGHVAAINSGVNSMINSRKKANEIVDCHEKAIEYSEKVLTKMDPIRYHCDKLELLVDNTLWPLAKYRELLFSC
jgi:glutamine synthetase